MQSSLIFPVILSGGAGSRLWPVSRSEKPKQFHAFGGGYNFLQEAVLRCTHSRLVANPIVVTAEEQKFLVAQSIRELGRNAEIIVEPVGRDSCAAIAAGCLAAMQHSKDALVLILAADHYIAAREEFLNAILKAEADALSGHIISFGVKPTFAATGYGYIKPMPVVSGNGVEKIERFVEKPTEAKALEYIRDGYLWNSGNFLARADVLMSDIERFTPNVASAVKEAMQMGISDRDFFHLDITAFSEAEPISIDFAVMEKTSHAMVLPVDYQWSDVGTWDSVYKMLPLDGHGNGTAGQTFVSGGKNNLVYSEYGLTVLLGVDDLVVVATKDAVLVTRRNQSEKVKDLVTQLKASGLV